jgi:hypothetical protein
MNLYGLSKHAWLSAFLALPNGIPSPDIFRRVFEKINPKQFEAWVREILSDFLPKFIAIDGKELRGSYDRESGVDTLHLGSIPVSTSALPNISTTGTETLFPKSFIQRTRLSGSIKSSGNP